MRKNILITGEPKSGKSTLLDMLLAEHHDKVGFLTKEIRKDDIRVGFEMVVHTGEKILLADVDTPDTHKVGKYFVHPQNIDPFLERLLLPSDVSSLLYMDEIGQMQLFSASFKTTALRFLDATNTCVATITSVHEDDFTSNVKQRNDIIFVTITPENRDEKRMLVTQLFKKIDKAKGYSTELERWTFVDPAHASLKSEHGTRQLEFRDNTWHCECGFFNTHAICSHVIAVEEVVRGK